jgi:biotin transport system substrate-specific component
MAVTLTTPNTILGVLEPKTQTERVLANVAVVLVGSLLLAASAKINVPTWPVPVTLQTFAVALIAGAYGWRLGVATVVAYLIEGAVGLPFFAGSAAGLPYLLGPTGGFLIGFIPMAAIIGWAADRGASGRVVSLTIAMLVGDAILFVLGFAWLVLVLGNLKGVSPLSVLPGAFDGAIKPFAAWDALKMLFAALTVTGLWSLFGKRG